MVIYSFFITAECEITSRFWLLDMLEDLLQLQRNQRRMFQNAAQISATLNKIFKEVKEIDNLKYYLRMLNV